MFYSLLLSQALQQLLPPPKEVRLPLLALLDPRLPRRRVCIFLFASGLQVHQRAGWLMSQAALGTTRCIKQ